MDGQEKVSGKHNAEVMSWEHGHSSDHAGMVT
jgi:hypothetical protein